MKYTLALIGGFSVALLLVVYLSAQNSTPRYTQPLASSDVRAEAATVVSVANAEVFVDTTQPPTQAAVLSGGTPAAQPASAVSRVAPSQPLFATQPLCFDGGADYAYDDAAFSIRVKRMAEDGCVYFVCDIQTPNPSAALKVGLSGDAAFGLKEHASDIASREGAILAINGDCYSFHDYGVIIRDGRLIRANKTTRHMLMLDDAGNLSTLTNRKGEDPKALAERLVAESVRQTWEFGPELIADGQATELTKAFDLLSLRDNALEPRTAIGQIGEGHYMILVVDGRREGYSSGVSLRKLQALCMRTGARVAFNLDGGGSTTLYLKGEVINRPSGGDERSVSDIIYF